MENERTPDELLYTSMWRQHTLKRLDYAPDYNGFLRFLYPRHFMSTAVAESSCLSLPLCEDSVDED